MLVVLVLHTSLAMGLRNSFMAMPSSGIGIALLLLHFQGVKQQLCKVICYSAKQSCCFHAVRIHGDDGTPA